MSAVHIKHNLYSTQSSISIHTQRQTTLWTATPWRSLDRQRKLWPWMTRRMRRVWNEVSFNRQAPRLSLWHPHRHHKRSSRNTSPPRRKSSSPLNPRRTVSLVPLIVEPTTRSTNIRRHKRNSSTTLGTPDSGKNAVDMDKDASLCCKTWLTVWYMPGGDIYDPQNPDPEASIGHLSTRRTTRKTLNRSFTIVYMCRIRDQL